MLKKLRSKAGLTIVEMMVTLVLLSLFSSACLVGITSAFASRRDHIRIGDADILKSTITEIITQELRMCTNVDVENKDMVVLGEEDGNKVYGNIIYSGGLTVDGKLNEKASLSLNDDDRLQKTLVNIKLDGEVKNYPYNVLNDSAYGENGFFKIKDLKFKVTEAEGVTTIEVSFRIVDGDDVEYTQADFTVVPLNWHKS